MLLENTLFAKGNNKTVIAGESVEKSKFSVDNKDDRININST